MREPETGTYLPVLGLIPAALTLERFKRLFEAYLVIRELKIFK